MVEHDGRRAYKSFNNYQGFIARVDKGEKCIVFGVNYVVLSRNVYDKMMAKLHPITGFYHYDQDEEAMNDWAKDCFSDKDKK